MPLRAMHSCMQAFEPYMLGLMLTGSLAVVVAAAASFVSPVKTGGQAVMGGQAAFGTLSVC